MEIVVSTDMVMRMAIATVMDTVTCIDMVTGTVIIAVKRKKQMVTIFSTIRTMQKRSEKKYYTNRS
jgi:hypothetical protein